MMEVPNASSFTYKCFRAAKATAMAAEGESLGAILTADEGRSHAFAAYVDEGEIDAARVLLTTLENESDEK